MALKDRIEACAKKTSIVMKIEFTHYWIRGFCLYLKGLPRLNYKLQNDLFGQATAVSKPKPIQQHICKKTGRLKNRYFCDVRTKTGVKTGHERSKTFPAIAEAMANQWTHFFTSL